jgi:hypothetical protein
VGAPDGADLTEKERGLHDVSGPPRIPFFRDRRDSKVVGKAEEGHVAVQPRVCYIITPLAVLNENRLFGKPDHL